MMKKVITLALCVGVLPFLFTARAYAQETKTDSEQQPKEKRWLDDYSKPVGFTYDGKAVLQTAYLWRGQYSGAANIQLDASVGYGGLYFNMWWNIGVTDWTFRTFQPEVDLSLGFNRWGLNLYMLYVHNFNCGFFDFANYADKGNRLELNLRYTLSSKIPLSILWGTRVSAADGYIDANGNLKRAYSSYLEISYTQALPYDLSLRGALGMTPWKSRYTSFRGDFAIVNIDISLRKDWTLNKYLGLMLKGQLMINPYYISEDKSSVEWHPKNPGNQSVNANLTFGVFLK